MSSLDHFRHAASDNLLRAWLEQEKVRATKALSVGEGPPLHRWQGRFQLLEEMLELMEKAKNLR